MSIAQRLFVISFLILGFIALAVAIGLGKAYSLNVETLIRERLKLINYSLLSQADNFNGEIYLPHTVNDERFNFEDSPLLAQVYDDQGRLAWRSVSATTHQLSLPQPEAGQWLFGLAVDEQGQNYYSLSYNTSWPDEFGRHSRFVFSVLEKADGYQERQHNVYWLIALATGLVLLALLLLQWLIVRLSLKPLQKLSRDIQDLNHGEQEKLASNYSKDLNPMALDLNLMIENERRQRQRYHDRMADLSHSLKTPLSVLRGLSHEAEEDLIDQKQLSLNMNKQLRRMRDIVDYQLQRAVTGNQQASFVAVSVEQEVSAIIKALQKVYLDKAIQCEIKIDTDLSVYADEQDMTEVFGNLCDNAFKYGNSRVAVEAWQDKQAWYFSVSDDGPGIPEDEQDSIFERGVRLDSQAEGQGFGLALVREILASYQAELKISNSQWQGARLQLRFPKNNSRTP
ncbi:ATP-binding protein [Pseudoteredinibacter isoporae]|uniref:ATP-binding protein n=1 Tax=Pseudoteredinibacter isoporae TaxID=570281 RepID=UPI00310A311A